MLMGKMSFAVIVTEINLSHNVIKEKKTEKHIFLIFIRNNFTMSINFLITKIPTWKFIFKMINTYVHYINL